MMTSTGAGLIAFREFLIDIIDDDDVMMIIDDPSSDPIIRVFILAPSLRKHIPDSGNYPQH